MADGPKSSPLWKETKPGQESAPRPQEYNWRCLQTHFLGMTNGGIALATASIEPFNLKSMFGSNIHVHFFLELTLGLKSLPPKAFLFDVLQVVAVESPFVHLVAGWGHVPSNLQHKPPVPKAPSVC